MSDFDDDDLGIDLTPLIDVIFMLVIFFIMTMTFSLPSIELELPSSETALRQARQEAVLQVSVNSEGQIFYNLQPVDTTYLTELLEDGHYKSIELNIDAKAPAQSLVDFADLARRHTGGVLQINTQLAD